MKKGSGDWWERLVITEVNDYYGLYISTPWFFLLMRHLAEAELRLRNAGKMRPTCLTAGLALIILALALIIANMASEMQLSRVFASVRSRKRQQIINMSSLFAAIGRSLPPRQTGERLVDKCSRDWWGQRRHHAGLKIIKACML